MVFPVSPTRIALACLAVGLLAFGAAPAAQTPVPLAGALQHDLASDADGQSYRLTVYTPSRYADSDTTRFPVLYLLDGHFALPLAATTHALMDLAGEVEGVILVGIGDGDHTLPTWFLNRSRDYTPTADPAFEARSAQQLGFPEGALRTGGAAGFLQTIRTQIVPFVESAYRTTSDRGIVGSSFGGLFAAYALLEAPDLFSRVGISSPSLWWGEGALLSEIERAACPADAPPVRVFVSAGALEPPAQILDPTERLVQALRARDGDCLAVTSVVFPDETHNSVIPAALARSLRVLYGTGR